MDIMAEKMELVKHLLDKNDINSIESIKSILSSSTEHSNDYANLPTEVTKDIDKLLSKLIQDK